MAPARSSTRRAAQTAVASHHEAAQGLQNDAHNAELFLDPNFGSALQIYIEKDVDDKDVLSQLIQKHGGTVSPVYSRGNVAYILVDPHKVSGQNLFKQYASKEGKIVLDARWVNECIKANALLTWQTSWGGCKVTGEEALYAQRQTSDTTPTRGSIPPLHTQPLQSPMPTVDPMYPFQMYPPIQPPRPLNPAGPGAWHTLEASQPITAAASTSQQHIIQRLPPPPPPPGQTQPQDQTFREAAWNGYHSSEDLSTQQSSFDYPRYREDQNGWVHHPDSYYSAAYDHPYTHPPYLEDQPDHSSASNSVTGQAPLPLPDPATQVGILEPERPRGRKRTRPQPTPTVPPSSLVVNRNPPARSPTPPTRVIKSTYGGNLFTSDDVIYLKKYIDYCQEQCLVLSLREICERIAVKAPHHTFYSWRRYCNKHKIKLGGYTMHHDCSETPGDDEPIDMNVDSNETPTASSSRSAHMAPGHAGVRLDMTAARAAAQTVQHRTRSPTPPRSLFRSTTGKGVAFTQEDVNFLMRLLAYRKSQGPLDLVAFWRDVAVKAPHHSRASWMKFWRRHKHELDWEDGDEPLPPPPDKKLRYSKADDILLARYFMNRPDGTSDKVFQSFGRLHPHHPWKGWQEHHRIHRPRIDQIIQQLADGENPDAGDEEET